MGARAQRKPHGKRENSATLAWDMIRKRLQGRRAQISREISAYPAPIAACDAHINHLLAEREKVSEELARLEEAAKRGSGDANARALEEFVRSSAFLKK
jgi:hypothetical protein